MLNDDYIGDVAEFIARMYRNKQRFLSDASSRLNLELSPNLTYRSAIVRVINDGKEKDFSLSFLNTESINEWIQLISRQQILDWFAKSEVLKIAKILKETDPLWSPDRGVKADLIFSILKRFNNDEIGKAIVQFQDDEEVGDYFFSTRDYMVGPLGILDIAKKKDWDSEYLIIVIISDHVDKSSILEFMDVIADDKSEFKISRSDPEIITKALQFILANYSTEEVFNAFGKLITFGIIQSRENPLENLVEIVIRHTGEATLQTELKHYGIPSENLQQGVLELCLRESPRYFGGLFGIDRMKDIARDLNMVALDNVTLHSIRELWDVILRILGFDVPSELVRDFLDHVITTRADISRLHFLEPVEKESRLIGLMIRLFSRCEHLIRDLFYFNAILVWKEELEFEDDEADLEVLNEYIIEEFELDDTLEVKLVNKRLTLGDWVGLLRRLDKYIRGRSTESRKAKSNLKRYTGRTELLGSCPFDLLNEITTSRNQYRHEKNGSIPSLTDSLETVNDIERLYGCFIENGVMPVVIRVQREIRNEFGLEYFVIIDENDQPRRIQKRDDIPTKNSFMIPRHGDFSPDGFIAIVPFW